MSHTAIAAFWADFKHCNGIVMFKLSKYGKNVTKRDIAMDLSFFRQSTSRVAASHALGTPTDDDYDPVKIDETAKVESEA